jgi:hypothetical protein
VTVNDRAPARHADGRLGRAQVSVGVTLEAYCEYMRGLHDAGALLAPRPPFYLNGWRAFNAHPELKRDCPVPYFMDDVDLTTDIMRQIDEQIFRRARPEGVQAPSDGAAVPWYANAVAAMSKFFLGPAGTVTRLHYDAVDAHGWLAQVVGTKLFVLFPPADTPVLAPIPGETETVQSGVDPLACACGAAAWPPGATPHVCVLARGEAILIPRGWWHYAAALDTSLTAQHNFYTEANAAALAEMIVRKLRVQKAGQ